jgi:hypothetical protein
MSGEQYRSLTARRCSEAAQQSAKQLATPDDARSTARNPASGECLK